MKYRLPDGRVVTEVANYGYLIAYRTDSGEVGQVNTKLAQPLTTEGKVIPLIKEPTPVIEEPPESTEKVTCKINKSTATQIARCLPSISRRVAVRIAGLRPEAGYKDLDHLKDLTSEMQLDWDELSNEIEFDFS